MAYFNYSVTSRLGLVPKFECLASAGEVNVLVSGGESLGVISSFNVSCPSLDSSTLCDVKSVCSDCYKTELSQEVSKKHEVCFFLSVLFVMTVPCLTTASQDVQTELHYQ